jgi:hypothetical protein
MVVQVRGGRFKRQLRMVMTERLEVLKRVIGTGTTRAECNELQRQKECDDAANVAKQGHGLGFRLLFSRRASRGEGLGREAGSDCKQISGHGLLWVESTLLPPREPVQLS